MTLHIPLQTTVAFPELRIVHSNLDLETINTREESTWRSTKEIEASILLGGQISRFGFWNIAQCNFLMPDKASYPAMPSADRFNSRAHYLGTARILEHLFLLQKDGRTNLPVVGIAGEFSSSRRWPWIIFAQWIESKESGWHIYSSKCEEAKPLDHAFPADCLLLHT